MRRIVPVLLSLLLLAAPVRAGERPVVVELFTSQGCSSCPPADAFFADLAGRRDVLALALHVDYWDYIGWTDSFGRPEHTRRQRAYARAQGRKMVYTPQIVINGREQVVGTRLRDVLDLIERHKARGTSVDLGVTRQGDRLQIRARALRSLKAPLLVQVVRYLPRKTVHITRGENAGRRLSYANVVTEMRTVTVWDPRAPLRTETRVAGDAPVAVLLQQEALGPVAAAARVE